MFGQKLVSAVQDRDIGRRSRLSDVGRGQRPIGKPVDMRLDFQPGMEPQPRGGQRRFGAFRDPARVER